MNTKTLRRSALCMAMGACLLSLVSMPIVHAANTDGSLAGRATAGAQVTVLNPETGFTRTVTADADGNYRFPFLPVGNYTLRASKGGAALGEPVTVTVALGTTSNANVGAGVTNLGTVTVLGSSVISPVDVTSTESATNITREELVNLPVERDVISVALLAPGLTRGDNDLGGVSFGGSSVSENTIYINGLNVTDFYNRVGFSSVPYAFYQEFQVKTGGYSVEFGRTTGGVINAVTRSGTNDFKYGAELLWEPSSLQSAARDRFDAAGNRYYTASHDEYERSSLNLFASGPIIKDRLFFFAMYEARDYQPVSTSTSGNVLFDGDSDDAFWGTRIDWQINSNHLLEFLAFSDENTIATDSFGFNADTGEKGAFRNTTFNTSGGRNWAATYTGYLTDSFYLKALYGENERNRATNSINDTACSRVFENRTTVPASQRGDRGCTSSSMIEEATDTREAMRLDFEWMLGDHQLRFGWDREVNTSDYSRFNPGPDRLRYDIFATTPGSTIQPGNIVVPPGVTAYVRTRELAVEGVFETINSAYYLEDNWSITDNFILNLGVRVEAFDNKTEAGTSFIKIDDMVAPRIGFSWDVGGEGRSKVFGNLGRYFLPVANVINIKQGGAFLDARTFYAFNGYEPFQYNGQTYFRPILGAQFGFDNSQGDGTLRDLRGTVDSDMDPVYQDEAILGFQSMLTDKWSWGIRGIYRKLNNAIDDMGITANGACGLTGALGFVMANPGKVLTAYGDTNCDGVKDGWVTIDTSREGWAIRTNPGGVYRGQRGWDEPRRTYRALEFLLDHAWDEHWSLNASYTYSQTRGNAEGPVTSDFNFADAGRTEAFDDPWVNLNGYGYLANDRRHQLKARGLYAINSHWQIGGTMNLASGRPISSMGVGNPFDRTSFHSFYVCVANCTASDSTQRVYELIPRGSAGRTPWTLDLGASVTYLHSFGPADLRVKFAVYNLLDAQDAIEVDERRDLSIGTVNPVYGQEVGFQTPRYGQLTITLDF